MKEGQGREGGKNCERRDEEGGEKQRRGGLRQMPPYLSLFNNIIYT